jgi:K+-transporting ATPase KdpF subunit
MSATTLLCAVVALGLFVYLLYALFRAEDL